VFMALTGRRYTADETVETVDDGEAAQ
jgi:hypothetical protein